MRRDRRTEVSRNFNLRHEHNVSGQRVSHELVNLRLRVEVRAINLAVAVVAVAAFGRLFAHRTDFGEARVLFDFDAPALVVGQMELQAVVFVTRHELDELFQVIRWKKMPRGIQQESAPLEARIVLYLARSKLPFGFTGRENELSECLRAIEESMLRGCGDFDA